MISGRKRYTLDWGNTLNLKMLVSIWAQRFLLNLSFLFYSLVTRRKASSNSAERKWVVGVEEIASMLWRIHAVVPNSISVSFKRHKWYSFPYTYERPILKNSRLDNLYRQIYGAWLLGKLSSGFDGFIYVGAEGFLDDPRGQRAYEFSFLKSKKKLIVCYFTGSEIRSHFLTKQLEEKLGFSNLASVREATGSFLTSEKAEQSKKLLASISDKYADAIFNWPVEQASYLKSKVFPFNYAYPENLFHLNLQKYTTTGPPLIVHAPSDEATKGTSFVREAINQLSDDGFEFEYLELKNVSNEEVLETLSRAHIVLNQFNQYTPCVFGIEAMANCCVMLCSGDKNIETLLPDGANDAWVVTRKEEIYDNLRYLLSNPQILAEQAKRGYEWALKNESSINAKQSIGAILESL